MPPLGFWFRSVSFLSAAAWVGLVVALMEMQPTLQPHSYLPANYQACATHYAASVSIPMQKTEMPKLCAAYYGQLGDRTVPWLERLRARTLARIIDNVGVAYLRAYSPQAGEVITGDTILNRLGVGVVPKQMWSVVWPPVQKPDAGLLAQTACLLKAHHDARFGQDLERIPYDCRRSP